ncbi:hypothetical protein [Orenia marismortui]|uniref:hypothetical protein n=1 Tax=Orenia marismortui TaxID=46469 RepID=UPI00035CD227|nr:hypothetical protein [Orenia marismortui]
MNIANVLGFVNSGIGQVIVYGICFGAMWFIDNKYNKRKVLKVAYNVVDKVEDVTEEGTTVDNFLDQFVKAYEDLFGKQPSAGELKTAADIKKKLVE